MRKQYLWNVVLWTLIDPRINPLINLLTDLLIKPLIITLINPADGPGQLAAA